ncbi:dTMP kinase [Altererythrobacter sp. SALINAS58]|uniref:dTMP kinase n=1 Tax=Alteripontixanthobacter muriae TaxID=2705546 RepID=UPI00157737F0|nr:dTMP kinase [Alteripontixanthobacter muriae]NTZ41673.1 dTMP kinase [Alteripontixanthobacter muriae]
MTRGKFIVFEGGEGAGKSTQARRLIGFLEERNIPTVLTREPGGTAGAEAIRTLLLDPPAIGEGWGSRAEALLFAAARSDHVEKTIEPALAAGRWVVCDRFLASSVAYQGGAGGLGAHSLYELHQFGSAGMLPDLTLILTISPALTRNRLAKRDGEHTDAISGRPAKYHRKVADAFATIAADPRHKACSIDANAAEDEVFASIRAAVQPLIEQRSR